MLVHRPYPDGLAPLLNVWCRSVSELRNVNLDLSRQRSGGERMHFIRSGTANKTLSHDMHRPLGNVDHCNNNC